LGWPGAPVSTLDAGKRFCFLPSQASFVLLRFLSASFRWRRAFELFIFFSPARGSLFFCE